MQDTFGRWGDKSAGVDVYSRYIWQMGRYSMFLGRKNQYWDNDYTTKCNLQIQ